ncbi:MAG: hypothetical protein JO071_07440 [Deltaproteobacteria bacterium]|nr:hypothetical protein [Deltaproteobacteria bacterium]
MLARGLARYERGAASCEAARNELELFTIYVDIVKASRQMELYDQALKALDELVGGGLLRRVRVLPSSACKLVTSCKR